MKINMLIIVIILSGNFLFAQQTECKVKLTSISGTYTGGCKNGLAHGKGTAQGVDLYEGQFYKGLPSGDGTYRWSNGSYYEGEWKDGLKEGKGKLVSKDTVITGFWEKDKYVGRQLIPPYKISQSINVGRSVIRKTISPLQEIKIRILQGSMDNLLIENFTLVYSSGDEFRSGSVYGIQNVTFPVNAKVMYSTWNPFRTTQFNVVFEFTINDPGAWDVTLYN